MENQLPKRKKIRLSDYDYSTPGAYFVTVCTANRKALFWATVIGQFKRFVSKQVGFPLWQKSFIDEIIRNEQHYLTTWQYIDNNPLKYSLEKQEKGVRNGQ
ncbi:MAG: hypothetical protein IJA87_07350 [Clostridia bacterium]|nr:hypothetical protein [Clostridia bacterium]